MSEEKIATIVLLTREDGGLRVYSEDMPGLILSGSDADKVAADIWPAIKVLRAYKSETKL